jgi:hypothetical protein
MHSTVYSCEWHYIEKISFLAFPQKIRYFLFYNSVQVSMLKLRIWDCQYSDLIFKSNERRGCESGAKNYVRFQILLFSAFQYYMSCC